MSDFKGNADDWVNKEEDEEPERKCPPDCGGCSCHINPPCHHCTDHWAEEDS